MKSSGSVTYLRGKYVPLMVEMRKLKVELGVDKQGALLATLHVRPVLVERILAAQSQDPLMCTLRVDVANDNRTDCSVRNNGELRVDGQSERLIQTLEDMLRACTLQFRGDWDEKLPLMEFASNDSCQTSIETSPIIALYGKQCRTPLYEAEVGEHSSDFGLENASVTNERDSTCECLMEESDCGRGYMGTRRPNAGPVPLPLRVAGA
ncbi:hypothetical protein L3X38_008961 [Prunus dulcis]|uniref:Uncharacterized protein n=1 Tax=Prunus dulcis TaxID=3755 RepID=A0AAD4ZXM6_PRUDU|nr:hypothetical protein L3X38_008961 [Prunus dulcis]